MRYLSQLCKLRYLSRGLRLTLLCYLCLVQFIAPLVHAHSITGDETQHPEGLHYLHSYGLPPNTLASLLTSTCENIEVAINELSNGAVPHVVVKLASPNVFIRTRTKNQVLSQALITCYLPSLFYYSCIPRSPPQYA
ncbi:MAG: hypothetical protein RL368_1162 [Pseudomonadota bacterium]